MAALTDQRLDATTKQTLAENEEMAGGRALRWGGGKGWTAGG